MKGTPASAAMTRANKVLPVPATSPEAIRERGGKKSDASPPTIPR